MARYLPFLISLALTIYALFSCIQTRDEDVPHLPKLVWIVLIVFVPFAGPIIWLLLARRAARPSQPVRRSPSSRPAAPDDDPDFLASLDRYRDPRMTGPPKETPETPETPDQDAADEPAAEQPKDSTEAPTEPDEGKA